MKRSIIVIALSVVSFYASAQFPASSNIYCYKEIAYENVATGVKQPSNEEYYVFFMFGDHNNCAYFKCRNRTEYLSFFRKDPNYVKHQLKEQLDNFLSNVSQRNSKMGTGYTTEQNPYNLKNRWVECGPEYMTYEYESNYSNTNQKAYVEKYITKSYYSTYVGETYRYRSKPYMRTLYVFNNDRSQMVEISINEDSSDIRTYYESVDLELLNPEKKSYEVF